MPTLSCRPTIAAMLCGTALMIGGCGKIEPKVPGADKAEASAVASAQRQIKRACASAGSYQRLKEVAFEEARALRPGDDALLDRIAAGSVVRMENPLVKSRDETLNVTVCTGRMILELPPGAAAASGGTQRLSADIEYAAQAALDGSGLVYRMEGAAPIVSGLAAFALARPSLPAQVAVAAAPPERAPPMIADAPPARAPAPIDAPRAETADRSRPAPVATPRPSSPPPAERVAVGATLPSGRSSRPSFPCRYARSTVERMVCASDTLAGWDRRMASGYYAAMAQAGPEARRELRRTRDRFLGRRDRCGSEACVAAAYRTRIDEIAAIRDDRL